MIKRVVSIALGLSALGVATVYPVLTSGHYGPRTRSASEIALRRARTRMETARVGRALDAIRRGDPAREAGAWTVMKTLPAGDVRRLTFAKLLAERGQARAAYEEAWPKAHFGGVGLAGVQERELYARLAERAGHRGEAAWVRGPENEGFRVWARGQRRAFAIGHVGYGKASGDYRYAVESGMNVGLNLFPSHGSAIEALRRELLTAP